MSDEPTMRWQCRDNGVWEPVNEDYVQPPPLNSVRAWHVGKTDNATEHEIRIVLSDPIEARAWTMWLLDKDGRVK